MRRPFVRLVDAHDGNLLLEGELDHRRLTRIECSDRDGIQRSDEGNDCQPVWFDTHMTCVSTGIQLGPHLWRGK